MNENLTTIQNLPNMNNSQASLDSIDPQVLELATNIIYIINIFGLIFFITTAIGLFLINKKLGEKYPWLSFVPIFQIYNYLTAAKKGFLNYIVFPVIALIIGFILSIFTYGISLIIALIYFFVMWVILLYSIAKRTGYGIGATIGFLFIPFIMYPVIGYIMKDKNNVEQ